MVLNGSSHSSRRKETAWSRLFCRITEKRIVDMDLALQNMILRAGSCLTGHLR
jgi:hypothetical protein